MSELAQSLRRSATEAEKTLWHGLRDRRLGGLKFRRQQPIAGGRYVADFVCLERKLIVEVDGSQHTPVADAERTAFLVAEGFQVLRFWNPDVLANLECVLETILAAAEGRLDQ
ncbi:endonuclease domain-containing protein [Azospirillum sp. sgz302134]